MLLKNTYPLALMLLLLPTLAQAAADFCEVETTAVNSLAFAKANQLARTNDVYHRVRGFVRETDPVFAGLCADQEEMAQVQKTVQVFLGAAESGSVDCSFLKPSRAAANTESALTHLHRHAESLVSQHDSLVDRISIEERDVKARLAPSDQQLKYFGQEIKFGEGKSRVGGLFGKKLAALRDQILYEQTQLQTIRQISQGKDAARACGQLRASKWEAPASAFSTAVATSTATKTSTKSSGSSGSTSPSMKH